MQILMHQPATADRPGLHMISVQQARPASTDDLTRKPGVPGVILLYILAAATIEGLLLFVVLR